MKLLIILGLATLAGAQTRTATLNWADTQNPAGTTYNVYRATGQCSGTPTFVQINTAPVAVKTYQDTGLVPGNYCYTVRAVSAGIESNNSNLAGAQARPFDPGGLSVTVQ